MSSPTPDEDFSQLQPELEFDEDFTEEDVHEFCLMICDLPSMALGEHLVRTDEQVKRFSHQLYLYCKKKGIDVSEYLFDEFGLIFSGFVLFNGYRQDHKKYKESMGIDKPDKKLDKLDDGIHQTVYSDVYEEPKTKEHRDSSSGGDNKPADMEPDVRSDVEDVTATDVDDPTADDEYTIMGGVPV